MNYKLIIYRFAIQALAYQNHLNYLTIRSKDGHLVYEKEEANLKKLIEYIRKVTKLIETEDEYIRHVTSSAILPNSNIVSGSHDTAL